MNYKRKYIKKYWKSFSLAILFLTIEAFSDLLQPTIMAKIIDNGVAKNDMNYVISKGGLMLIIASIGAIGAISRNIVSSNVSQKFGAELRSDLFRKIQTLSFDNINKFETASLITRLTNDVTQVQNFVHRMMRIFVKAPILCVGSLIMATLLSPRLAIILALIIPIVGILIYFNMKIGYPHFKRVQKSLDKVNSVIREYLSGIRVVKAFNRFDYEKERFESANSNLMIASTKAMRVMSIFTPSIILIVNFGIVLVLWFGGVGVDKGNIDVGKIIAFINYMTQILFSLMMISMVFNMLVIARASVDRIEEVFNEENNIKTNDKSVEFESNGSVVFENVYFSYLKDTNEPVLKNITFSCLPGETIGIIGATGAGKSTIVNLIAHFYDVTKGKVIVNGIDVKDIQHDKLMEKIAIVPQKNVLFTGTILDNIRWGKEDATLLDVEKVAKIAQAHDFICKTKDGYNTILGQGGINISGGQKQRISIARALVKEPEILILDDSTSALDNNTEIKLRQALKDYSRNLTTIIIAQKITSVIGANKIIVLDDGVIAGIGKHEELIKSCEVYKDIFRSQIGKEAI